MVVKALRKFIQLESFAGILLMAATVFALLIANSPVHHVYEWMLSLPVSISVGALAIDKPLLLWINDGLMAVFFLLIGLEVKREVLEGQLSSKDQILLPAIAAVGGFVLPALVYTFFNFGDSQAMAGWAIPAATDIAFALGIIMLLGSRVPLSLKVFLTSIAIFDDIAAIVVIALFYSSDLSGLSLLLGALGLLLLVALNRAGVRQLSVYLTIGVFVWICVLKSGVHATIAGFLLGLTIPLKSGESEGQPQSSPLRTLEHQLHPWVAWFILPVFAFANAGVSFSGVGVDVLTHPVAVGIAAGLFIGKQMGVFLSVWVAVRLGLAKLPAGANWLAVYGVSLLTGIGFTMSLFVGSLAFEHGEFDYLLSTRIGVLIGSLASALAGFIILRLAFKRNLPNSRTTSGRVSKAPLASH